MNFRQALFLIVFMAISDGGLSIALAVPIPVYFNDFENAVGTAWSAFSSCADTPCINFDPAIGSTPSGRKFLTGDTHLPASGFNNQNIKFNLAGLPAHDSMTLSFDLFLIRSWRGDSGFGGTDDLFGVQVTTGAPGGLFLLNDTFSNWATFTQSYPGTLGIDHFAGRTGAAENNTLGYQIIGTGGDSVYNMNFTFSHIMPPLDLTFFLQRVRRSSR